MNNRGFGLSGLLAFIVLMGVGLFAFYMFVENFLAPFLKQNNRTPNFKNEYIIYMKEHNIELEK